MTVFNFATTISTMRIRRCIVMLLVIMTLWVAILIIFQMIVFLVIRFVKCYSVGVSMVWILWIVNCTGSWYSGLLHNAFNTHPIIFILPTHGCRWMDFVLILLHHYNLPWYLLFHLRGVISAGGVPHRIVHQSGTHINFYWYTFHFSVSTHAWM